MRATADKVNPDLLFAGEAPPGVRCNKALNKTHFWVYCSLLPAAGHSAVLYPGRLGTEKVRHGSHISP
jgi:hypothetical protein